MANLQLISSSLRAAPRLITATTVRIIALALVLLAGTAAIYAGTLAGVVAPDRPITIPWWVIAGLYAVVETRVVDFHYRGETHSYSLSEVPLVLAFFFLPPDQALLSVVVGTAVGLVISREQGPAKAFFNLTQYAFSSALALAIFHAAWSGTLPAEPADWGATLAAVTVCNLAAVTAIAFAILVTTGSLHRRRMTQATWLALVVGVTNACLGLVVVTVLAAQPLATWLLVVPAAMLFLAYRAYIGERLRHERIEMLYDAARILQRATNLEPTVVALLEHACRMLSAEIAELTLMPAGGEGKAIRIVVAPGGDPAPATVEHVTETDPLRGRALTEGSSHVVDAPNGTIGGVALRNAVAVPLRGEHHLIGIMVIANRDERAGAVSQEELRLVDTVANHAADAFENSELERSVTRIARQRDSLHLRASHDPLTGLPNRRYFLEELRRRLALGLRRPAVLFIDLDEFKAVNDEWGHGLGDAVLTAVAGRLNLCVARTDVPARLGGDEFAVIVDDAGDLRAARRVASRILDELRAPIVVDGHAISVGASIGIASADGREIDPEGLIALADEAMYNAKHKGKGHVAVAETDGTDGTAPNAALADLTLAYQPVVELRGRVVVSVESLLRHRSPAKFAVTGDHLLTGLSTEDEQREVTRLVLWETCAAALRWSAGRGPIPVGVNLAGPQLLHPALPDDLTEILAATGLPPVQLEIEVSEGSVLAMRSQSIPRIQQLNQIGVGIVLDDLAADATAFSALRDLPLRAVKLAPSLLADGQAARDTQLLRGVVALVHALGAEAIAKGVERPDQLRMAIEAGCRFGQGYLLARPMPEGDVARLLAGAIELPVAD